MSSSSPVSAAEAPRSALRPRLALLAVMLLAAAVMVAVALPSRRAVPVHRARGLHAQALPAMFAGKPAPRIRLPDARGGLFDSARLTGRPWALTFLYTH